MKLLPILEDIIAKDKFDITIDYGINRTKHAKERQSRHKSEEGGRITEKEIEQTVEKAIKKITLQMIIDILDLGDKVLIKNKKTNLHIVGGMTRGSGGPNSLNFKVITVMREKNFRNKSNTPVIEV